MLKNEIDEITMLIDETQITMTFMNKGEYAVHDLVIKGDELEDYQYHIDNRDRYPITVNTSELLIATKSVGRKDGLKIYWVDGSDKLSVEPIKSSKETGRSTSSFINIIHKPYSPCQLQNNDYGIHNMGIKIQNREFADICNQANILKCNYLEISGCHSYVHFKGILPDGTYGMDSKHLSQNHNDDDDCHLIKVKIPICTIKTLAKLHQISHPGTLLKFFFDEYKPVKIESKIGSYGTYKIYLRNCTN
ncbi:MAG TPA: hypothetical protein VLG50_07195 [Candidatus Saccharimonadales bacterium]|nr:hypothetical protein [Candidatus Saccharimonadales bacterium]